MRPRKTAVKGGDAVMLARTQPRDKIDVRIKPDLRKAIDSLAKARGVTFSRAVEYLLETGLPVAVRERE